MGGEQQKKKIARINNRFRRPSWADLPTEILSNIADRLDIIQLLSFRGTCKDFRRASVDASAKIESNRMPWLLAHNPNLDDDDTTNNCFFYKHHRRTPQPINLPQLKACIFLASYQGWLLVFKPKQRSIFFFSPFSLSKIDLPDFPIKHLRHHAAAFSDLPTSPHCIVSIRIPTQVLVISRGDSAWTRHKLPKTISRLWPVSTTMTCAAFDQNTQTFYYVDNEVRVLKFSVKDNKVYHHPVKDIVKDIHGLPFRFSEDPLRLASRYHARRYNSSDAFHLQQGKPLNLCGCILDTYIRHSNKKHSFPNQFARRRDINCDERWGVWIQPRFFQAPPNTQW